MPTPAFALFYEKTDITASLKDNLIELSFIDYMEGESDELSVTFFDEEGKWIKDWFPTQGDKLHLQLGYEGRLVSVGSFEIAEIDYAHDQGGSVVSLKALATGLKKSNRTLKPRAFENTTLANIVGEVAKKQGLKLVGNIDPLPVQRITQYQETDLQFLTRLAKLYGYYFKIQGQSLVFYKRTDLETGNVVRTIDFSEVLNLSLKDRITRAYQYVTVQGFDANTKKTFTAKIKAKPARADFKQAKDENGDTLSLSVRAESQAQVDAIANANLAQNRETNQAGNLKLVGDPCLVAGQIITLSGVGVFNGKHLVTKAIHSLSRTEGYTTELDFRLVEFSGKI